MSPLAVERSISTEGGHREHARAEVVEHSGSMAVQMFEADGQPARTNSVTEELHRIAHIPKLTDEMLLDSL